MVSSFYMGPHRISIEPTDLVDTFLDYLSLSPERVPAPVNFLWKHPVSTSDGNLPRYGLIFMGENGDKVGVVIRFQLFAKVHAHSGRYGILRQGLTTIIRIRQNLP